jgi:hypothetical protein
MLKVPKDAFVSFVKAKGATYTESNKDSEDAIFIIPKKVGSTVAAFELSKDGSFRFGALEEDCQNFVTSYKGGFLLGEIEWMQKMLLIAKEWNNKGVKKDK